MPHLDLLQKLRSHLDKLRSIDGEIKRTIDQTCRYIRTCKRQNVPCASLDRLKKTAVKQRASVRRLLKTCQVRYERLQTREDVLRCCHGVAIEYVLCVDCAASSS